jgi:hypothetical protein
MFLPSIPQNLVTQYVQGYVMSSSSEIKPLFALNILILGNFDLEKALKTCTDIGKSKGTTFQGIYYFTILNASGNPVVIGDSRQIGFITDIDSVKNIVEKVKLDLGLADGNMSVQVIPQVAPSLVKPSTTPVS